MSGKTELHDLLCSMSPILHDDVFVFSHAVDGKGEEFLPLCTMFFRESEGVTLVWKEEDSKRHDIAGAYRSRMITLSVHSSLEAVGFLAAITAKLAAVGISVNAVSAFYHDHLFVPVERADDAMRLLKELSPE